MNKLIIIIIIIIIIILLLLLLLSQGCEEIDLQSVTLVWLYNPKFLLILKEKIYGNAPFFND